MKQTLVIILVFFLFGQSFANNDWQKVTDLSGIWKFKIGDNPVWADPAHNDSNWDEIYVPAAWEDEGYNGYDGFAWYRKEFGITTRNINDNLVLSLGLIDDAAEVYINGIKIGASGSMPPKYKTAYNNHTTYNIPGQILKIGSDNIVAVRVYDGGQVGGIYTGDIGIFVSEHNLPLEMSLEGIWKFKTGDKREWKNPGYDDSNWEEIIVPWDWEYQGYEEYNGFAWYRKKFRLSKNVNLEEELILMVGRIDDADQTFLNGYLVGSTGDLITLPITNKFTNEFFHIRAYYLDKKLLNINGENVVAVRVYDGLEDGGIYKGPVGITSLKNYEKILKKQISEEKSFIERLFDE